MSENGNIDQQDLVFIKSWLSDRSERFDVNQFTKVINFSQQPSFTDPLIADACIEVLTSNGHTGSLSHVRISHNPKLFAADLRELLGVDKTSVILSGGMTGISEELIKGFIEELNKVGFVIFESAEHLDTLGRFNRQATLFADHAIISKRPYGDNQPKTAVALKFP